jgi:hypothetical protein
MDALPSALFAITIVSVPLLKTQNIRLQLNLPGYLALILALDVMIEDF